MVKLGLWKCEEPKFSPQHSHKKHQLWWHMFIVQELRRQKQEDAWGSVVLGSIA